MRKFKKVLITGINGSGGSYLADYIINNYPNVKIYGNIRSNNYKNIEHIRKRLNIIKCDLNNNKDTFNLIKKSKPDAIFHLASMADVRESFNTPLKTIINNNNCTLNLLESIRLSKIKPIIMICSTSEVYGQVEKKYMPISEKQNLNPINPYAVSKTFQDILAYNYYLNYNLNIIITRMFTYLNARRINLFASNWAYQIAKIEKNLTKYLYHGNLQSSRNIIDINDAMEAYWIAATKGKIGEIYNIGGSKQINLKNFLKILISKSKHKIITKLDKKLLRTSDITQQIPNSNKFRKQTKWKPKISFDTSIENLLNEMRIKVSKEIKEKKQS